MSRTLSFNGYQGSVDFDLAGNCLCGEVLFVNDTIIYQGRDLSELRASFEQAVVGYLETCREVGKAPDRPFSGSFNIRMDPELHKRLALVAVEKNISINAAVVSAVTEYVAAMVRETRRARRRECEDLPLPEKS